MSELSRTLRTTVSYSNMAAEFRMALYDVHGEITQPPGVATMRNQDETNQMIRRLRHTVLIVTCAIMLGGGHLRADWPQWGGPDRNFVVDTGSLADKWPDTGPKRLWHRKLGTGYSSVLCDDGMLFTMYRKTAKEEITIALDAKTGRTIWEHKTPSPPLEGEDGPFSTPLIVGNRLFALSSIGVLHCFDKKSGIVLWKHDLPTEFGCPLVEPGYVSSPIAYKGSLILAVGKQKAAEEDPTSEGNKESAPKGQSLLGFDQQSGDLLWKELDFESPLFSSPMLITIDGQDQLVFPVRHAVLGIDPNNGETLWRQEMKWRRMAGTPVWDGDRTIIVSAGGLREGGAMGIELNRQDGRTVPKELWYKRKLHPGLGTHVYATDVVYMGRMNEMVCFALRTGRRMWRKRGFPNPSFVLADGKLVILDVNGKLTLATPSSEKLAIHAQHQITERHSLSAPTLVGTTLYVRDRKHIMAFDLSVGA